MEEQGKAIAILVIIGLVGVAAGGWILANFEPQRTGTILLGFALGGLIMGALAGPLKEVLEVNDEAAGPEITGSNIGAQFIGGFLLSIVPIILSVFTPLSIGLPELQLSIGIAVRAIVSIVIAPIVEELFFLTLAIVLYLLIMKFTDLKPIAITGTMIVISVLFAGYHWVAYGATFLVGGAFIGAAVFRFLTLMIVIIVSAAAEEEVGFTAESVAPVIISLIIMHSMFNGFVFAQALSIVGG